MVRDDKNVAYIYTPVGNKSSLNYCPVISFNIMILNPRVAKFVRSFHFLEGYKTAHARLATIYSNQVTLSDGIFYANTPNQKATCSSGQQ